MHFRQVLQDSKHPDISSSLLLLNPAFSAVRASTRLLPQLQQSRGNHCHHTVNFNPGENRLGTGRFQTAGGPILSI